MCDNLRGRGIATSFRVTGKRRTPRAVAATPHIATSVTVLEPSLRGRLDAGTQGVFSHVHVDSVRAAVQAIREHVPAVVLLSPSVVNSVPTVAIRQLLATCPGVAAIAVVEGSRADDQLLTLRACGVRKLVDLSDYSGWKKLRSVADGSSSEITRTLFTMVMPCLDGANTDVRQFFGTLIRSAPLMRTVNELAHHLEICPSTLMSRFFRRRLPAPKMYLAMMRLVHASAMLEHPQSSIANVALCLRFSSSQSFGRNVRTLLGLTAGEFRREMPLPRAVNHFLSRLILPYLEVICAFRPINPSSDKME